ncbi:hypothetical protein L1987_21134 [Smallanthus sonchifolius]|uniref:Uncharacterized protein n=1 Tax=Smallanthus sonchifolius TaxID=185202 RepID=A0ACB9IU94_9ASTR|nr:hypothetical protein L1987_21134 [Smallanthus sonchifolius]
MVSAFLCQGAFQLVSILLASKCLQRLLDEEEDDDEEEREESCKRSKVKSFSGRFRSRGLMVIKNKLRYEMEQL